MGEGLFFELGIRIGMNSHATLEPDAAPDECRIRVNDLLLPAFRPFGPGEFLVRAGPANLSSKGLSGRQWNVPVTGGDCADVYLVRGGRRELEACRAAGWVTWGPIGWCVLQLAAAARAMAGAFVMPDVMALWITQLRLVVPQLVDAALGATGRDVMTAAMRMLAEEGVTLRDQRELLEAFASEVQPLDVDTAEYVVYSLADSTFAAPSVSGSAAMDPVAWSDLLRRRLKRSISHRAARGGLRLDAVLVHPSIENRLLAQGAIDPADAQRLAAHALEALRGATEAAGPPVLLCGARVRRLLRDALYVACPGLPVLAFEELHPEQDVRPFARIEVEG
jgi:flagellar biosynthesis protein FlhA